jgi:hypothetical protein
LFCAAASAQALVTSDQERTARQAFAAAGSAPRLRCSFSSVRPALDYAMRFRAGYTVSVPLMQFTESTPKLGVFLRVTPEGQPSVYFIDSRTMPPIPNIPSEANMGGFFLVGEGAYAVDAVLQDDTGSACSGRWRIEAKTEKDEQRVEPGLPALTVLPVSAGYPEPAPARTGPQLERLDILLHAAPWRPGAGKLEPEMVDMLAHSLLSVCRQLPAKSVRLVIFNLEQQAVLLEKPGFTPAAVPEVRAALDRLDLTLLDYRAMQGRDLFRNLVEKEARPASPSAVVWIAPRTASRVDSKFQPDAHALAGIRWYYLQYEPLGPRAHPATGRQPTYIRRSIYSGDDYTLQGAAEQGTMGSYTGPAPPASGRAPDPTERFFHRLKGETFSIYRPQDLATALRKMTSELNSGHGL